MPATVLNYLKFCNRASGLEIVNFAGLNDPLLPQNPLEKEGASPPTFSKWSFGRRGSLDPPKVDGFQPRRIIA